MYDLQFATLVGGEHRLAPAAIAKFVSGLRGTVLRPADIGYDDARKVWNGMVDKRALRSSRGVLARTMSLHAFASPARMRFRSRSGAAGITMPVSPYATVAS